MTKSVVEGLVGQENLPDPIRPLISLGEIDYVDHFTLSTDTLSTNADPTDTHPTDNDASAEQWARAMFGDVPSAAASLIWRGLLHLRLSHRPSPNTVAGWRVTARDNDWIRLEAASWFLTANLVISVFDHQLSLTTAIRYDRLYGRFLWPRLAPLHRRLSPGLLTNATAKIGSQRFGHRADAG